jgi:xanthine dehydrogenase FAD-binding subunit
MDELWEVLERRTGAFVYAGGTDLLVRMKKGMVSPPSLICLERIGALQGVRDEGDEVWIGACTSHSRILQQKVVQERFPVLTKALSHLGSPHIRNMGTIGGNIVTASPAGDTLPALYVLDAVLEIETREGSRTLPIKDFIKGPGITDLGEGEILTRVKIKKQQPFSISFFEKVGQRKAMAISIASVAALLRLSGKGLIEEARLAWGSVGPTVVTSPGLEAFLVGKRPDVETMKAAAGIAMEAVSPIDDIRASKDYRRQVAGNLLMRLAGDGCIRHFPTTTRES